MNPWSLFLIILGWGAVVVLILLLALFVVSIIVAVVRALRPRRVVKIMSSRDDDARHS